MIPLTPDKVAEMRQLCKEADITNWPSSEGDIIRLAELAHEWLPHLLDMVAEAPPRSYPLLELTAERQKYWDPQRKLSVLFFSNELAGEVG